MGPQTRISGSESLPEVQKVLAGFSPDKPPRRIVAISLNSVRHSPVRKKRSAMPNERITEDFVRDHFKNDPLFKAIKLDEQKTSVAKAKGCLANASKNLTGKGGSLEFIISFPALPDDVILVECKADAKFHESANGGHPTVYAVDGALHYSSFLAQDYNVISVAVSGSDLGKLKISSFYQKKGQAEVSAEDFELLDVYSYIARFNGDAQADSIESAEITKTAIELNK
jgi:type I restriction enzyme M protein